MWVPIPSDKEHTRILASVKVNIAAKPKAWRYTIDTAGPHAPAGVKWLGECDTEADSLTEAPESPAERSKVDDAVDRLEASASRGPGAGG